MGTYIRDKHGKIVRELPDTGYHPDGTGPRDADGRPIAHRDAGDADDAAAAAPDTQYDTRSAREDDAT